MNRMVILIVVGVIAVRVRRSANFFFSSADLSQSKNEEQKLNNPILDTPESIAKGRESFKFYCRQCHGPMGKGDGSMALGGGTPSDLTDDKWDYGSTDGEIFIVIKDGTPSTDMEGYGRKLSTDRMWHLVNFVKSLSEN